MLNLMSIVLGLIAIGLPILVIIKHINGKLVVILSISSFIFCNLSLVVQFYEINRLVNINDMSAIMDIIGALSSVVIMLVIVVSILNIVACLSSLTKEKVSVKSKKAEEK